MIRLTAERRKPFWHTASEPDSNDHVFEIESNSEPMNLNVTSDNLPETNNLPENGIRGRNLEGSIVRSKSVEKIRNAVSPAIKKNKSE